MTDKLTVTPDQFAKFLNDVGTLRRAGAKWTPEADAILTAYEDGVRFDANLAVCRVTDAVLSGLPATDVQALVAQAIITSDDRTIKMLRRALIADVGPALIREYDKVSVDNYMMFASKFVTIVREELAPAVELTDPDATAESLLEAPKKTVAAWKSYPDITQRLDELAPLVALAAVRTRMIAHDLRQIEGQQHRDDWWLGLFVANADDLDRRQLWRAWDDVSGRGGRWARLVQMGADLQPPANPASYTPQRRPWDVFTKHVAISRGVFEAIEIDPELPGEHYGEKAPADTGFMISRRGA